MTRISDIRVVFMGSPDFALPSLRALSESTAVIGVITQPDRPSGRGRALAPPPVKLLAQSLGIPIIQPERLRDLAAIEQLQAWRPDLIIVAAFGQILRPVVLELPYYGCLNVHASLLPRWRGAAPIQAAILAGDEITGATIIRMDPGIDTGPILSQRSLPILANDTSTSLGERLATLGAQLLMDTLPGYLQGDLDPQPQPETGAAYAPMINKEDGLLDFSQPAAKLARQVRAYNPWPGTHTSWSNRVLKIHHAFDVDVVEQSQGKALVWNGFPAISTAQGILVLSEVQPAGKKTMSGSIFLLGARDWGK